MLWSPETAPGNFKKFKFQVRPLLLGPGHHSSKYHLYSYLNVRPKLSSQVECLSLDPAQCVSGGIGQIRNPSSALLSH